MNRKIARSGGDPRAERHKVRDVPTFAEAAARVLEQKRPGWRSGKHPRDWISSLRAYAFPELGHRPVGEIMTADILAVPTPIWHGKHVTARRVRQRIGVVMKWAVAMGLRPDNPRRRRARSSAWPAPCCRPTHESVASLGGHWRDRGGADFGGKRRDQARLRVHGADGVPFRRGSLGGLG